MRLNLLKVNDRQLGVLAQAVADEARRRAKLVTNGRDSAGIIYGNEMAKRALEIAAAGKHSILLLGPANSGKTMLRAVGLELGLREIYEARRCPCGNYDDVRAVCKCTVRQLTRAAAKFPPADITVSVVRPTERDRAYQGLTLADMKAYIAGMSQFVDQTLDVHGANLLKASAAELPLDPAMVTRILRVARTIANLDRSECISPAHLCEAINYRPIFQ